MSRDATKAAASVTARIVWDTADKFLRNVVEPQEYGDYILPFTVLRRLECLLEETKPEVVKYVEAFSNMPPHLIDIAVRDKFGLSFYNVSPLNLATIASVDDNVDKSLLSYVAGFSQNVADIWTAFEFPKLVAKLTAANRLHAVVKHFSTLPLGSTNVEDSVMGDIFEDVMYRAFDKKGKAAGAFYTPRDAIKLMVDVLFSADEDSLAGESTLRSIYDPTAGSGGMLLVAQDALKELNPDIKVTVYGQELMDAAYALGKADLLIQGGRPDAIRQGDTLITDLYEDQTFDYVLSNPPFGGDWEVEEKSVREQAKTPGSRFSHGLPSKSDGQMLFLCHCASKLSPTGGRAAVVSNASPLFNSDSGPNSIRQWLFDEDLIDAIIALPTQMFYGTGIATYVWILDNNKPEDRRGKIQLIDASGLWEPMRKPLGDKRREMSSANRATVVEAYEAFTDSDISRVLTSQDFMFRDVPVFKQARLAARYSEEAVDALRGRRDFGDALIQISKELDGTPWNLIPKRLPEAAKAAGLKAPVGLIDAVMQAMAVPDESAPPAVDRKGQPVLADGWKITERVPMSEDLDEHMAREVLPFAPEAKWDESKAKHGNEIPFTRLFHGDGAHLLANVPEDWRVTPAWAIFEERGEKSNSSDIHLTPSQLYGVISQDEYMEISGNRVVMNVSGSDNMKAVKRGDFIIHLRSFQGGIEFSDLDGKVSAAYTVLKPVAEIHHGYFRHLMKSNGFITELSNLTFQLRDGQTINYARFARMKFPVPPLAEQARIAAKLDALNAAIAEKQAEVDRMRREFSSQQSAAVTGKGV